jgi:hypothetical protein
MTPKQEKKNLQVVENQQFGGFSFPVLASFWRDYRFLALLRPYF